MKSILFRMLMFQIQTYLREVAFGDNDTTEDGANDAVPQ